MFGSSCSSDRRGVFHRLYMALIDLTFRVAKPKLQSMRQTLRELSGPDQSDWSTVWKRKCARLEQVLDFAEARAQKFPVRCLTDEFQLRRFNLLFALLVSWPSAWEALGDHESVTIPGYTQDWSSSSAELREEQLEESQEDSFRRALVDLERLRVITWLPEARRLGSMCRPSS